jgi:hypothetical protein
MFDDMGFAVADFGKSKAFYEKALAALGGGIVMQGEDFVGFGGDGRPSSGSELATRRRPGLRIAPAAANCGAAPAFYEAAMAACGKDNGHPACARNVTRIMTARL